MTKQKPLKQPTKLFDIHGLGSVWSKKELEDASKPLTFQKVKNCFEKCSNGRLKELLESPPEKRRAFGIVVK